MSFVSTVPELVESAAGELENIRSTLGAATATAATPTTGIVAAAQDEVSVAIAALFGAHAQQFQSISAQASAFHGQFVRSLTSSAGAYLGAEVANAQQVATSVQSAVGSIASAPARFKTVGAPTLLRGGTAEGGGPYQQLFANTSANLQALRAAIAANPAPLLHQFLANQQAYAQRAVAAIQNFIQNFPDSVSTAIQAFFERLAAFDPVAFLQQVINNQIGYAHTIGDGAVQRRSRFQRRPGSVARGFRGGLQDVLAGNIGGAVSTLGNAFVNLFFTGFDTHTTGPITNLIATVTPTGTLRRPVAHPHDSRRDGAELHQPLAGGFHRRADVAELHQRDRHDQRHIHSRQRGDRHPDHPARGRPVRQRQYGMPVALLLDAAGAPVNALHAADVSATAFSSALEAGNFTGAADALVNAPAVIANGFLNGQMTSRIHSTRAATRSPSTTPWTGCSSQSRRTPLRSR